jgi:hypothetical protein
MRRMMSIGSALIVLGLAGDADAASWRWGCQGGADKEQVIFGRYTLVIAPLETSYGKLNDLIHKDQLPSEDPKNLFQSTEVNGGFEKSLEFKNDDGETLVLTEQTSRRISNRERRVGPRDETTTTMTKTYRYVRGSDAPRTVTMTCMEYTLSTKGGRR